ncbi:MAG: gliding motility-associated C-terminal domain-containing protein [Gilvibacter sp.]
MIKRTLRFLLAFLCSFVAFGQDIELFEQFNGRYDYLAIGNTMNIVENAPASPCEILTASSADLFLEADQEIQAAFLYWAGSGIGDFDILLNDTPITPDRTFADALDETRQFFAAVTEITTFVRDNGNITYTVSELDLTDIIPDYCPTGTNFAGWSIIVIYKDDDLPLNQVNIYEGLQSVPTTISIELESLNVLDDIGAKIGFLAWEGDQALSVTETLSINGDIISNPPLNPADNAFNSTNSFTGSTELYNMDIDFYNIEDNIEPGDTSALIELTSGQDFVMVNNIITVLNSQLPDATIELDFVSEPECGSRTIAVDFTVYNVNSTDVLPANTPIAFFANSTLVGTASTLEDIPIEGSESQSITLTIPESVPNEFTLRASADNTGADVGVVRETDESNNDYTQDIRLLKLPVIDPLENIVVCEAEGIEVFDLTLVTAGIDESYTIGFYLSLEDAQNQTDPIDSPEAYINTSNPQTIYVRVSNPDCFIVASFTIEIIICPLPDATIEVPLDLTACQGRLFTFPFTIFNTLGTAALPAGTPIAFYINEVLVGQSTSSQTIEVGGSLSQEISIGLPEGLSNPFSLLAVVDDDGSGLGIIEELNEFNNVFKTEVSFAQIPSLPELPNLLACDKGFDAAPFDLTQQNPLISSNSEDVISYYTSAQDAQAFINAILDPTEYVNQTNPQEIFVRLDTPLCFAITSFLISVENCPPEVPEGFSPNSDGINDSFEIVGLLDIFENHKLLIYSRNGNLIFEGDNITRHWQGIPNTGFLAKDKIVPPGVYYYLLYLNDPEFNPIAGWLYLNR